MYTRARTHTHKHTNTHTVASREWLTETDRHAYRLKKGWAEREWQRERDAVIHSHIQIEADSRGPNKKTDTQTRPSDSHLLYLSVCVLSCSDKHLATNWFGSKYWFSPTVCLDSGDSWAKRWSWRHVILCSKLSVFGNAGLLWGNHLRHRKWSIICLFGRTQAAARSAYCNNQSDRALKRKE